jgi:hypothetical protein
MLVLGFKLVRLIQWAMVVREGMYHMTWGKRLKVTWLMLRYAWKIGKVTRAQWRYRMRRCQRCPIYDRQLKRCQPQSGSALGCMCYVPFAALSKHKGWMTEVMPAVAQEQDHCW